MAKAPVASAAGPPRGRRLWLFRTAAVTLMPLLVLGGTEAFLRLAGYGHSTSFFKPLRIRGTDCLVENDRFGLRFFPPELARSPAPVVVPAHKPAGTYRVFLFGESAALGDPAPAFGVGRYLQALLRQRYRGVKFEVVCVAMTAVNSHAILPIARECARHEGDLWILYMGNNEMVGPFGAATVFGDRAPPVAWVRLRLALQQTRLHQVLTDLAQRWRRGETGRTWEGMKLFQESQIAPDDPAREIVHRNFRANLDAILRTGERAGVPVLLSTVAVNLKDFPPLASLPAQAAGTNLPTDFARLATAVVAAQAAGDWTGALRSCEAAAALAPRHAETEFRLGQCHLALSNRPAAQTAFSRARDADALPFRTDSRLNAIIREAAQAHAEGGVHLFDAEAWMAAHSPDGIPGDETFYEHVHLHFDGNFRLARGLAEKTSSLLPTSLTSRATAGWASQEQCEQDLGLTDWNRRDVFDNVVRRLGQPPFTGQRENAARQSHWRTQWKLAQARLTATNAEVARAVYRKALEDQPDDFRLHWNFADFLEAVRDLPGAAEAWRQVQSLIPHHHVGHFQVGRLLAEQGQGDEARRWLQEALKLRPDLAAGWLELGKLSVAEGRYEAALADFACARELLPQSAHVVHQMAKTLSRLKRSEEALELAQEAVRLDPDHWEAHALLGEELAFAGRAAEAQREFETTLGLKPGQPVAHLNLGVAHFKQGRQADAVRHFEEALRLDPNLRQARAYLEQLKRIAPTRP